MKELYILDFSGMATQEGFAAKRATTLGFTSLEGTSLYCDKEAAGAIRETLKSLSPGGIHWIDTGDYHYATLFFLEKIDEDFELVLLDNHPDDQSTAFDEEMLSCGSWVKEARKNLPHLKSDFWIRKADDPRPSAGGLPVYISIDKDVLSEEYARTDWDQGEMKLEELSEIIRGISGGRRILGIDVCGGKTLAKGASGEDLRINLEADLKILALCSACCM